MRVPILTIDEKRELTQNPALVLAADAGSHSERNLKRVKAMSSSRSPPNINGSLIPICDKTTKHAKCYHLSDFDYDQNTRALLRVRTHVRSRIPSARRLGWTTI